jgi:hypothetical protein
MPLKSDVDRWRWKKDASKGIRRDVNKEGCDSRLRVLGAAGLSSGFASSHFDGFGIWLLKKDGVDESELMVVDV